MDTILYLCLFCFVILVNCVQWVEKIPFVFFLLSAVHHAAQLQAVNEV